VIYGRRCQKASPFSVILIDAQKECFEQEKKKREKFHPLLETAGTSRPRTTATDYDMIDPFH
jgi:hypothetical protein